MQSDKVESPRNERPEDTDTAPSGSSTATASTLSLKMKPLAENSPILLVASADPVQNDLTLDDLQNRQDIAAEQADTSTDQPVENVTSSETHHPCSSEAQQLRRELSGNRLAPGVMTVVTAGRRPSAVTCAIPHVGGLSAGHIPLRRTVASRLAAAGTSGARFSR